MLTRRQLAAGIPLALASVGALALGGCGTSPSPSSRPEGGDAPLDLRGTWKQVNSKSPDSWQEARIEGDVISIDWTGSDGTRSVYWVGSYDAPTAPGQAYSWDSKRDVEATEYAMLASQDDAKKISYEGGRLKWEATALGTTVTVECERQG